LTTALVSNIQKYSIHDGPGIRSTIFLKGCPLLCPWCHNPETQLFQPEIMWYGEKCIGCMSCREACPHQALEATERGMVIDAERCDRCGKCADVCPALAMEKLGQEMTVDQVLAEITTPDMSIGEKAYEIYKYTKRHIAYTGTYDKTDWRYEAYRGITKAQGDCFTYYATAKCLLERIGAQTMCVERYGGNRTTHHYWLLVDLGSGWYHFDAVRRTEDIECFMRTDASLMADGPHFWSFNYDLYPSTPTTPYVME
jgi:formate hydrogenlyase subunit 6/NADH:ubiquinone oxidoreductase subunit I